MHAGVKLLSAVCVCVCEKFYINCIYIYIYLYIHTYIYIYIYNVLDMNVFAWVAILQHAPHAHAGMFSTSGSIGFRFFARGLRFRVRGLGLNLGFFRGWVGGHAGAAMACRLCPPCVIMRGNGWVHDQSSSSVVLRQIARNQCHARRVCRV